MQFPIVPVPDSKTSSSALATLSQLTRSPVAQRAASTVLTVLLDHLQRQAERKKQEEAPKPLPIRQQASIVPVYKEQAAELPSIFGQILSKESMLSDGKRYDRLKIKQENGEEVYVAVPAGVLKFPENPTGDLFFAGHVHDYIKNQQGDDVTPISYNPEIAATLGATKQERDADFSLLEAEALYKRFPTLNVQRGMNDKGEFDRLYVQTQAGDVLMDTIDRIDMQGELTDNEAIEAALRQAKARGWPSVQLEGSEEVKLKMYLYAKKIGLEVTGFKPTEEQVKQHDVARDQDLMNHHYEDAQTGAKQYDTAGDYLNRATGLEWEKATSESGVPEFIAELKGSASPTVLGMYLKNVENAIGIKIKSDYNEETQTTRLKINDIDRQDIGQMVERMRFDSAQDAVMIEKLKNLTGLDFEGEKGQYSALTPTNPRLMKTIESSLIDLVGAGAIERVMNGDDGKITVIGTHAPSLSALFDEIVNIKNAKAPADNVVDMGQAPRKKGRAPAA
jgi:hypothetical protein